MSVNVYNAIISTAFDRQADIVFNGLFLTKKEAFQKTLEKIFECGLITRKSYSHDLPEEYTKMTDEEFIKTVCQHEVNGDPSVDHLEEICDEYSDDYYKGYWEFVISEHAFTVGK